MFLRRGIFFIAMLIAMVGLAIGQEGVANSAAAVFDQATLIAPSGVPFHIKALITSTDGPERTKIEMFWVSPDKWRRTIESEDFSQTLVVNGDQVYESDSDDYFRSGCERWLRQWWTQDRS